MKNDKLDETLGPSPPFFKTLVMTEWEEEVDLYCRLRPQAELVIS